MELGLWILYFIVISRIYCIPVLSGAIILTFVEEELLDALIAGRFGRHGLVETTKKFHLQIYRSTKQRPPSPESLKSSRSTATETAPTISFLFLDFQDVKPFILLRPTLPVGGIIDHSFMNFDIWEFINSISFSFNPPPAV